MTTIMRVVTDVYEDYMASGDPRVTHWMFMSGPAPTFILVALYVLFVKVIGPSWMINKKPYDLRYTMFIYNMGLVLANICLLLKFFMFLHKGNQNLLCMIEDKNDPDNITVAELGWWFFFLKYVEFADTIFFVLRKKFNHISTLHVLHHGLVPIAVWAGLRIEPGGYNYFFPVINTLVHTIMYSYYGLAALGPSVQKYLWWKKYLTTIQMVQFVTVFFYVTMLMTSSCRMHVSKFIIYLNIFLAGLFLIMFYDYFRNTYIKKRPLSKKSSLSKSCNGVSHPGTDRNGSIDKKID